jgi:SLOG cluster2
MIEEPPKHDWTLALSVSGTPDLEALGMFEHDDKRVLSAVLTPLVYHGARIAYGGRIDPPTETNFTQEISTQLGAAYRASGQVLKSRPLIHYLRANDLYREGKDKVWAHALRLGAFSEIKLLSDETTVATLLPSGTMADVYVGSRRTATIQNADELGAVPQIAALFTTPPTGDALAGMRRAMAKETDARIMMGGRVGGSKRPDGTWWGEGKSGIAAEAVATLEVGKPLIVIGGIGGASRDVAGALGLIGEGDQVLHDEPAEPTGKAMLANYRASIDTVRPFATDYQARLTGANLLDNAKRLAVSDSYTEIATLVMTMLPRLLPAS